MSELAGTSILLRLPTREPHVVAGEMIISPRPSHRATAAAALSVSSNVATHESLSLRTDFDVSAPVPVAPAQVAIVDTKPIQIWEGVVLSVDEANASMNVCLTAMMGAFPEHSATIDLQWVHNQDYDLVRPGAVFYLTLFKKVSHGSIQNSQEIRFRRRPSWTDAQVRSIEAAAQDLVQRMALGDESHRD